MTATEPQEFNLVARPITSSREVGVQFTEPRPEVRGFGTAVAEVVSVKVNWVWEAESASWQTLGYPRAVAFNRVKGGGLGSQSHSMSWWQSLAELPGWLQRAIEASRPQIAIAYEEV